MYKESQPVAGKMAQRQERKTPKLQDTAENLKEDLDRERHSVFMNWKTEKKKNVNSPQTDL